MIIAFTNPDVPLNFDMVDNWEKMQNESAKMSKWTKRLQCAIADNIPISELNALRREACLDMGIEIPDFMKE